MPALQHALVPNGKKDVSLQTDPVRVVSNLLAYMQTPVWCLHLISRNQRRSRKKSTYLYGIYVCIHVHWVSVSLLLLFAAPWDLDSATLGIPYSSGLCEEKPPRCLVIPKGRKDAFGLGPYR